MSKLSRYYNYFTDYSCDELIRPLEPIRRNPAHHCKTSEESSKWESATNSHSFLCIIKDANLIQLIYFLIFLLFNKTNLLSLQHLSQPLLRAALLLQPAAGATHASATYTPVFVWWAQQRPEASKIMSGWGISSTIQQVLLFSNTVTGCSDHLWQRV